MIQALLLLLLSSYCNAGYSDYEGIVKATGHRGWSSVYPEHTMIAINASIDGADSEGVEIDVFVVNDGETILMHDTTLDRTTNGTGATGQRDWSGYIEYLDAGSWKSPAFTYEKVPLLMDVTDYIYDGRLSKFVVLDLKEFPLENFAVLDDTLTRNYGDSLYDCLVVGCWTNVCVDESVRSMGNYHQMLITSLLPSIDDAVARGLDILSISFGVVRNLPDYVREAQEKGLHIHVWTVNSENDIRAALALGVDSIISDYPERVMAIRDGLLLTQSVILA